MIYKFSTPTCCMCKNLSKVLAQHDIKYTEVDCTSDKGAESASEYNISGVPSIVCVKGDITVTYRTYGEILKNIDIIKTYAE